MFYHKVEQGEYLSSIAQKYGFADFRTLWDHAENAELKKKRGNPNILFPGDQLFVPDRELKEETKPTDNRHRFQVTTEPLMLRLVIKKRDNLPVANTKCQLEVDGVSYELRTDEKGKIEQEIPRDASGGKLVVRDSSVPIDLDVVIKIGHLDPIDEPSGQKGRLNNLGYNAGDGPEDDLQFRSAVEEFQCDNHLTVDGICGPKTQAKLKDVHGC